MPGTRLRRRSSSREASTRPPRRARRTGDSGHLYLYSPPRAQSLLPRGLCGSRNNAGSVVASQHLSPRRALCPRDTPHTQQQVVDVRAPTAAALRFPVPADVEHLAWNPTQAEHFVVSAEDGHVLYFDARAASSAAPAAAGGGKKAGKKGAGESGGGGAKPLWTLKAHDKPTTALSFCPAVAGLLATGSVDKTVKLWDVSAGRPTQLASKEVKARCREREREREMPIANLLRLVFLLVVPFCGPQQQTAPCPLTSQGAPRVYPCVSVRVPARWGPSSRCPSARTGRSCSRRPGPRVRWRCGTQGGRGACRRGGPRRRRRRRLRARRLPSGNVASEGRGPLAGDEKEADVAQQLSEECRFRGGVSPLSARLLQSVNLEATATDRRERIQSWAWDSEAQRAKT